MMTSRTPDEVSGAYRSPDRPVAELFQNLATETGKLIRQEVKLAAGEMSAKATYAGKQVAIVATGVVIAAVALVALGAAITLALALVIPAWAAALVVTAIYGGAGYGVAIKGITALQSMEVAPKETVRSLEETKQWAQEQVR